ncbi:MAG: phosphate transport regulator [Bdellovibrionales bacterium GWB1_55_8]|nr:MAG: phosphate transport regulator [Bdellovibrionales bacterium GWB1_55_8]
MFGLIPREEKFFVLFRQMTATIVESAVLLKEMMDDFHNPEESRRKIKDLEHRADHITHDVIEKLNKSFITPFDREDIYALASKLDDIIDLIDASAVRFVMYNVEKPTPQAKEMAFLILKGTHAIEKAVAALGEKEVNISQFWVEANELENEADRVCREAISRLFDEEKDPIQLIKWKEIYETLERATDKVEDAANIIESVVVKNA